MGDFEYPLFNLAAFGKTMESRHDHTWLWNPLGAYPRQFALHVVEIAQELADTPRDCEYDIRVSRRVVGRALKGLSWKEEWVAGLPFPSFTRSLPEVVMRDDVHLICDSLLATTIAHNPHSRYTRELICHGLEWCCTLCSQMVSLKRVQWVEIPLLDRDAVMRGLKDVNRWVSRQ